MKKILFSLLLAVIAVGISSCSKEEDDDSIYKFQVNLCVGDTLICIDLSNLVSDDKFVATTNNNKIIGSHVGKTTVRNSKAIAYLEVTPKYNLFEEPNLNFKSTKSDIKNYEKLPLQKETDNELYYKSTGNFEYSLVYGFNSNGTMKAIMIMFKHDYNEKISRELGGYFAERYYPLAVSGNDSYFLNNFKEKADVAISVALFAPGYDGYGYITYTPYTNN